MPDPTHDNLPARFLDWLKGWGGAWLVILLVMFGVLYLVGKLA